MAFDYSDQKSVPRLGVGTWRMDKSKITPVIHEALKNGYKLIDTAKIYDNMTEVGEAIATGLKHGYAKREELFITCKLWNDSHHDVRGALEDSLKQLNLEYFDTYLMHFPLAFKPGSWDKPNIDKKSNYLETYREMERLVGDGRVRSIGVCNFSAHKLKELLNVCRIRPIVVQNEYNPYMMDNEVTKICKDKQIGFMGYSNLRGNDKPSLWDDETIKSIAEKHKTTVPAIILSWVKQKDFIVIPKTNNPERVAQNKIAIKLSESEMKSIDSLNKGKRYVDPVELFGVDVFKD